MDAATLISRVRLRYLDCESQPDDDVIDEYLTTVTDRLCLLLDVDETPEKGASIIVDATMKALRLRTFEGSTSESSGDGGTFSNSFVDNILAEYADEISRLRSSVNTIGVKIA